MIFIFLLATALFSQETSIDPYAIAATENEPSTLVEGKVSAITGDLYLFEEDLVVQGQEPIHIGRSLFIRNFSNWRIFPHIRAAVWETLCTIAEPNGSEFHYKKVGSFKKGGKRWWKLSLYEVGKSGCSNTARGKISGRSNAKNTYAILDKEKRKNLILYCSDGTVRNYQRIRHEDDHYHLTSEALPNGNRIFYSYLGRDQLSSIRTTDPSGQKTYAFANFHYPDKKHKENFDIYTSDGRIVQYRSKKEHLVSVTSSANFEKKFSYQETAFPLNGSSRLMLISLPLGHFQKFNYYNQQAQVVAGQRIEMEDIPYDIFVQNGDRETAYHPDLRRGRVQTIEAPVGRDSTPHATSTFIYFPEQRKTSVFDVDSNRTDYFWNSDLYLKRIERYSPQGNLHNIEKFCWGEGKDAGNLLCRSFLDCHGTLLFARKFTYDGDGNILEERFYGNLSGHGVPPSLDARGLPVENGAESCARMFRYTFDSRHLPERYEEENGLSILCEYVPNTILPSAEWIFDRGAIKRRRFWEYNSDLILIREIIDDGSSRDRNNFTAVHTRLITEITPKPEAPYLGMPWIIEEKTWDGTKEILLKKTFLAYTTGGNIAEREIYDAEGRFAYRLKTTYDAKGRPIEGINAMGQVEKHFYDELGNEIASQDHSGKRSWERTFDFSNRLIASVEKGADGIAATSHYTYDKKNRLTSEDHSLKSHASYTYNSFGALASKTLPPLPQHTPIYSYESDSVERIISETDPEGGTTRTAYNAYNLPIRIQHPDGAVETFSYFLDGTLKTHIDPEGVKTSYSYDFLGREVEKTISFQGVLLATEKKEYDSFHLIAETDAEGDLTHYTYDSAGRLVQKEREGNTTEYRYDALGRQNCIQKGDLFTCIHYDLLNRIIEERQQDAEGHLLGSTAYTYDETSNRTAIIRTIDGQPSIERTFYDSQNRPVQKTDPLGHTTTISYTSSPDGITKIALSPDGLTTRISCDRHQTIRQKTIEKEGILLSIETYERNFRGDPLRYKSEIFAPSRAIVTSWRYDSRGRPIQLIEAQGTQEERTTTYSYTPKGLLKETILPSGTHLAYSYTPLDSLSCLSSSDGTIHLLYKYDRLNRLTQSTDLCTGQTTQRNYDAQGNLLKETLGNGLSLSHTYDSKSRRTALLIPDGSSIRYIYDPLYLRSIARYSASGALLYEHQISSYDLSGHPLQELLIGDLGILTRSYDPAGHPSFLSSPFSTHQVIERDPDGNILQAKLDDVLSNYTYDSLSQLTQETGAVSHSFLFDAHSQRLQKNQEIYSANALLQIPSHLQYDPNGNPIAQEDTTYSYDALGRLIAAETPTVRLFFTYDALHRRLSKTVETLLNGTWEETERLFFLYDDLHEIGALNAQNQIAQLRILGATTRAETGAAIAIELGDQVFAPIHDLYGNVHSLISLKDRNIAATYCYSAFGEEESSFFLPNPWRFASKRLDPETNLLYFGHRYYSPSLGRWLTPDPSGPIDGLNLYAFAHNNPLFYLDSFGLFTVGNSTLDQIDALNDERFWQNLPLDAQYSPFSPAFSSSYELYATGISSYYPDHYSYRQGDRVLETISPDIFDTKHTYLWTGKYTSFDLKQGFHLFANGMGNPTLSHCLSSLAIIKNLCDDDLPAIALYTPTRSLFWDVLECIWLSLGLESTNSKNARMLMTPLLENLRPNAPANLVLHSMGALIVKNAFQHMDTKTWEGDLRGITIGPASIIRNNEFGFPVVNAISCRDPIPLFHFGGYLHQFFAKPDHVNYITKARGPWFTDHSMSSPTYQNALLQFLKRTSRFAR